MKGPLPNTYIRQKDKKNEKPRNTPESHGTISWSKII